MSAFRLSLVSVALIATAAVLLGMNGCSGTSTSAHQNPPPPGKIEHVVIIFQENRSTDNLFHGLPNADTANTGTNSLGQTITLSQVDLAESFDLDHSHGSFVKMYDNGKMDGADLIPVYCPPNNPNCAPPNPQFTYVNPSEVQPYFQMAQTYTFGDRMFQTNQGPSFPAHQFIISGTSAPTATSNLFAEDNLNGGSTAGCIALPGTTVTMIDATSGQTTSQYPCFDHPTLTDLLDGKGLSWRYYAAKIGTIWTGPNAIQHMCVPQTQGGQLVCTGGPWNNVIVPETTILNDISNGALADVSWVTPDGAESDHPDSNNGSGPSWVASIVNAIGNSSYWANTAIFITWDDWGGFYDHVAPNVINQYEYGFRVPLIVVSPYAKPGHVSHVTHDFGSILKFIEETYSLGSLGYADAAADDLSDCFDFNQTPLQFHTVAAPLGADHFLNHHPPPTDPDDD